MSANENQSMRRQDAVLLDVETVDRVVLQLSDWVIQQSLDRVHLPSLLEGVCRRLNDVGIPIVRGHLAMTALHPMYGANTFTWEKGKSGVFQEIPHETSHSDDWQLSPLKRMLDEGVPEYRFDMSDARTLSRHPLLQELKKLGGMEYLSFRSAFGHIDRETGTEDGLFSAWVSSRPTGFADIEVEAIRRLVPRIAVAAKVCKREQTALNVVRAYMGRGTASRVLDGQIKLGDGEIIPSVIWFSDMRDSTRLCEDLSPTDYLRALNQYFACSAGAVQSGGGEVLRFVGDAVLAIWPIAEARCGAQGYTPEMACRLALEAAYEAEHAMDALNRQRDAAGEVELNFGLSLHVGEVMYGNIGIPERIEFSVTGPAANEAARLESLTKEVGVRVLVSDAFAGHLEEAWEPMGKFDLKGVEKSLEVFAPPFRD